MILCIGLGGDLLDIIFDKKRETFPLLSTPAKQKAPVDWCCHNPLLFEAKYYMAISPLFLFPLRIEFWSVLGLFSSVLVLYLDFLVMFWAVFVSCDVDMSVWRKLTKFKNWAKFRKLTKNQITDLNSENWPKAIKFAKNPKIDQKFRKFRKLTKIQKIDQKSENWP